MNISKIIDRKDFKEIIEKAQKSCDGKEFSDIIDDEGYQYVDLVMEGGGMLGIALVGYTYILEAVGIRFLGVGGTSAGSINALLLAALGEPAEKKGDKLLNELFNKNFFDFVDGDSDARDLIESWVKGSGNFKLAFKAAQVIDNIQNNLGLNPGTAFTEWINTILKNEGIETYAQLQSRLETLPKGLRTRAGLLLNTPQKAGSRIAIIAADISTETKVEFPKMAELYWKNPENVSPAQFVRASMSIPFFFYPFYVKNLPQEDAMREKWDKLAGYKVDEEGGIPKVALFIDGGVMSNFPIDVFHDPYNIPIAPTFGVKLELDQRRKKINGPFDMLGAMFNSARHTLDYDFIHKNQDYLNLVTWIPAKGYNWLDFNMPEEKKISLFLEGAKCAADFLLKFNWSKYKELRKQIMLDHHLTIKQ